MTPTLAVDKTTNHLAADDAAHRLVRPTRAAAGTPAPSMLASTLLASTVPALAPSLELGDEDEDDFDFLEEEGKPSTGEPEIH